VGHVVYTIRHFKLDLRETYNKIGEGKRNIIHVLRLVQRISSWIIVGATLGMVLTGLNGYAYFAQAIEDVIPFEPHRVFDLLLVSAIIIHVATGIRFALMRRRVDTRSARRITLGLTLILLVLTISLNIPSYDSGLSDDEIYIPPGYIQVGEERVDFRNTEFENVDTVRPDIFRPGFFSAFDVLVYLDGLGRLDLEYHFNASLNTHVIDSLNGEPYWWYALKYSGGWTEGTVYRMDHYIWKPGTWLTLYNVRKDTLDEIYNIYAEEVQRLEANNGVVILPQVEFNVPQGHLRFDDIVVTPHNMRNQTLQDGVITALDVIMTLGDLGLISYELQWYESIGTARIVQSYWVDTINNFTTQGICGFVYETGSWENYGFGGNHIHLPSDVRVLNSPDYMLWFWICI
jgi:succinate dehydrogenase/fumarate reductase cytochrome b subunit